MATGIGSGIGSGSIGRARKLMDELTKTQKRLFKMKNSADI
jgi:hypothetical protein